MHVRAIAPQELNALLSLYHHLNITDDPVPEMAVVESVWAEIQANPRCHYIGCYVDEQLLSCCTLTVIPNLTRGCKPYGVIENVVTHASHRNKSYGKAVLAHALSIAWSGGCYKVMLLTGLKDEATFQFYESAGFNRNEKQAFVSRPVP
jgi:GNAT superfamily N-acetyltransferase